MRAVVIATGEMPAIPGINLRQAVPLLYCVDRPALQHVVETVVEQGVTSFDFILHEASEEIEAFLGDGARWGASFRFHLARNAAYPYRLLNLLDLHEPVLLAHADCLPVLDPGEYKAEKAELNALFCFAPDSTEAERVWTGWARLTPETVSALSGDLTRAQVEAAIFAKAGQDAVVMAPRLLELGTLSGILNAQRDILESALPGVHLSARQVEPGVWISRNVVIHPTATLTAPLFIGENSRIGAGVRVGPNAVVGHDSVIDRQSSIQDATILPGSYCGEGLELHQVYVDRNRLIHVGLQTEVHISDSFILGTMRGSRKAGTIAALASRIAGVLLFVVTLPLLALAWIVRGGAVSSRMVLRLPALPSLDSWAFVPIRSFRRRDEAISRAGWGHALFDIIPNLFLVAAGRLRLVGVEPRTREQVEALPEDWRVLYLEARAGLITEADVVHGDGATEDDIYSSEMYYTAMGSIGHDLKLILKFSARLIGLRI